MSSKKINWEKVKTTLKVLPKGLKYGFIIMVILTLTSTGVMFNTVFSSQTKTTKFGLENVGELVTQTSHLTIVKDNKVDRMFFNLFEIPFTESRQIFSYDVEVDASVDFAKVSWKPNVESEEIIVKLPHAKIYKTTLNTESLNVYLDTESLFSRIDLTKQNEALNEMKKQGEEDAKENGLLEAADENAKRLIEGFIKSDKEYKDYIIVYQYIGE